MALTPVNKPAFWDGCLQTFSETTKPIVIRSDMEAGSPKVRRRFTSPVREADASVTLYGKDYDAFWNFFVTTTMGGVHPFKIKRPFDQAEEHWAFAGEPTYAWLDAKAVTVSFQLIQTPEMRALP
jgi:hypothetical protein